MSSDAVADPRARVRRVIARTFSIGLAELPEAPRMGNPPQWDSLAHMNLVIELEREFAVSFPTHMIAELSSEEKIAGAIERQSAR